MGGEKKQSVGRHKDGRAQGGRKKEVGEKKNDLKEPERKAEGSDADREKMFNLARRTAETLNLLQSSWTVRAG